MIKSSALLLLSLGSTFAAHQANGFKVGEVSSDSATVWTRTTANAEAIHQVGKFNFFPKKDEPLNPLPWQAPGQTGEVKIIYYTGQEVGRPVKNETPWMSVDSDKDFTKKFNLKKLQPNTTYAVEVHSRKPGQTKTTAIRKGSFKTAPLATSTTEVNFNVITCQGFHRRDTNHGHQIYDSMLKQNPDFLVHTGDVIYYDKPLPYAKDVPTARYKWNRIYALPKLRNFHQNVSCYYLKDDHDVLKNDAWPGQTYGELTFAKGLSIYREQTPFPEKTPYRTFRWGRDVQIWLMEGRDFRTPNNLDIASERSIWGKQQLTWLSNTLTASDATFKFILTPTPIVGPDRAKGKNDNHANASHKFEGDKVRALLAQHDAISICGDRHWQYASFDPITTLKEFACGPASDIHSRGYSMKERKKNHKYLKICGGFFQVQVKRTGDKVTASFTHHAPDGSLNNKETITR